MHGKCRRFHSGWSLTTASLFRASECQDVLFAVLGISPAILTETIWALAHETEPFIPERVVALTTTTGRACIQRALFDSGGWDRLIRALEKKGLPVKGRLRFGPAGDHIRLFPRADGRGDLEDIVTAEESMTAADFILRALREYTENPDSRIVASLAGGRKTMGALLTSCMTLLGRTQDRLVHVLVNSPYDSPKLEPPFLFPEKGLKHRDPSSDKLVPSTSAGIELTEIPFVRMRGWYEREYRKAPASFMAMVRRFQDLAPEAANYRSRAPRRVRSDIHWALRPSNSRSRLLRRPKRRRSSRKCRPALTGPVSPAKTGIVPHSSCTGDARLNARQGRIGARPFCLRIPVCPTITCGRTTASSRPCKDV